MDDEAALLAASRAAYKGRSQAIPKTQTSSTASFHDGTDVIALDDDTAPEQDTQTRRRDKSLRPTTPKKRQRHTNVDVDNSLQELETTGSLKSRPFSRREIQQVCAC